MSAIVTLREYASYPAHPEVETPPPSTQPQLDAAITQLRDGGKTFAKLSIDQRITLAQTMQHGYLRVAARTVNAGCQAKHISSDTPAEAEEWSTGPWGVVRQLRLIREALRALKRSGNTPIGPIARTVDGRLSVRVFPGNAIDGLLFRNISVDVHMQAGVSKDSLEASRANFYKHPEHDGRVVLVLGAGNIAAIAPMDVITKMFNEGKVCLLKMNPVNAYLGPYIEEAFAESIKQKFLAVVYGGAEEGRYLVYHQDIDEVHITGSDKTHDQIVWGPPGQDRQARKGRHDPLLTKPITSELGNISPVIVVPGPYTDQELRYQAEDAAAYFTMNASFLCNAAKFLITPNGWSGSNTYLQEMQNVCAAVPPRHAYYPGAEDRLQALTHDRTHVKRVGNAVPGTLPWTFITGLDASAPTDPLFRVEPFCSIISEARIGSTDPIEFLESAVEFANQKLWGTLSATLVVHPKTLRDPRLNEAVERAITRLRYGTVAVNGFPGLSFVFAAPPWGAYPDATLEGIQSGRGFVHNTSMLAGIDKIVMRSPLTTFPKPGYFPSHRSANRMLPNIVAMDENASWRKVPGIVSAAMRG